ncbi:5'-deoxynucleotidase HDDC2 isoform X1 [Prionailurus iriomotensis]
MASASAAALSGRGAQNLLQFLRLVGQLKRVPRTGWVYRNVQSPESVSDHMYRMAIMALVTKDEHLNKDRCIRLALVHDMAECIVGDIAPADNIPKEEKHRREEDRAILINWKFIGFDLQKADSVSGYLYRNTASSMMEAMAPFSPTLVRPHLIHYVRCWEAMKQLTQLLPEDLRKELYGLWEEYETQSSAEAKFVKQLDQCEMILQASEYEDLENTPGRLQDFYDSTAGKFSHPEIVQLVSELEAERNANIAAATSEPRS